MGVREQGLRRIGAVTGGIAAASVVGSLAVGAVARAQTHSSTSSTTSTSSTSGTSSSSGSDSGSSGSSSSPSLSNSDGSAHAQSSGS
jgi:hypothetical protein